jgi:hypothetical protein
MDDYIELVCIELGGKLRVRITSANYLHFANVQFPRDIRVAGRRFKVKKSDITLVMTRGKYFYSVKKANAIEILAHANEMDLAQHKIFEDEDISECVVCLSANKEIVYVPCFHYYCCGECSKSLKNCPICRVNITNKINKELIG